MKVRKLTGFIVIADYSQNPNGDEVCVHTLKSRETLMENRQILDVQIIALFAAMGAKDAPTMPIAGFLEVSSEGERNGQISNWDSFWEHISILRTFL
jgi:hypothetical protein